MSAFWMYTRTGFKLFIASGLTQNALVAEFQTWIVFFHHKEQQLVNLAEEGGVYQSLHASLTERAAESRRTLKAWEEKQAQKTDANTAKL